MKQWSNAEDLIKKLKADFKANGIKATIRKERDSKSRKLIDGLINKLKENE